MLRSYNEAQATLNGPSDVRGDGDSVNLMPRSWNESYRELERCLRKLRAENAPLYAHIRERFLADQPYNEIVRKIQVNDRGNLCPPANTEILVVIDRRKHVATARMRRWHNWVRREKVDLALDMLAAEFRGEPYIEPELRTRTPIAA